MNRQQPFRAGGYASSGPVRLPESDKGGRFPALCGAFRGLPGSHLVTAQSDKEGATPTWRGGYGFHPLSCYLDETSEALAGVLA